MNLTRLRALENVKAFVKKDFYIVQVIESLNLQFKDNNWKKWYDEFGNRLSLNINQPVVKCKTVSSGCNKDLFYKAGIKRLSEISSCALVCYLKSSTSVVDDVIYIWFLGNDNRVRFISFFSDRWSAQEPVLSKGILPLKYLFSNIDCKSYVTVDKGRYINSGNFSVENIWFTQWPPSNNFKLNLLLSSSYLGKTIIKDAGL
jgi:hypothetical protein